MTLTIIAVPANQGFALLGKNETEKTEKERERVSAERRKQEKRWVN